MRLADPEFDFTNFDAVMVVMPSSHFGDGTTGGKRLTTDEGTIWNTTRVNSSPLNEPREPYEWGDLAAHELVHNLGLADLYPYDGNRHKSPYRPAGVWVETEFGLMGLYAFFPASEDDPRLAYRVLFPNGQRQTWLHPISTKQARCWRGAVGNSAGSNQTKSTVSPNSKQKPPSPSARQLFPVTKEQ